MSNADISESSVAVVGVSRTPSELLAIANAKAGKSPPFPGWSTDDGYCSILLEGTSNRDWLAMIAYTETKIAMSGRQPTSADLQKLAKWRKNYRSVVVRAASGTAAQRATSSKPAPALAKRSKQVPVGSRKVATSSTSESSRLDTF